MMNGTSNKTRPEIRMLALIGVCLLYVQGAERALKNAIEIVLKDGRANIEGQTEAERKRTLGDLVRELRKLAKIERGFRDTLYRFLNMRNTFIHNFAELPGRDLDTEKGREAATKFLAELLVLAFSITGVFVSLFTVVARDEFGEEFFGDGFFDDFSRKEKHLLGLFEEKYVPTARKIWRGRNTQFGILPSKTKNIKGS